MIRQSVRCWCQSWDGGQATLNDLLLNARPTAGQCLSPIEAALFGESTLTFEVKDTGIGLSEVSPRSQADEPGSRENWDCRGAALNRINKLTTDS